MTKQIKLHIGCGTVYLQGYINIHPAPDGLALFYPEEAEYNKTTVDEYYKYGWDERPKKHIADIKASLEDLPNLVQEHSVDEICMFHVLEHIPKYDLEKSLQIITNLLKPGGTFRVAVPDLDGFVLEYAEKLKNGISEEEKEWYIRCIHGTQKDKWSHHYCGYNKHTLVELLKKYNFEVFEDLKNQNMYPSIHIAAILSNNIIAIETSKKLSEALENFKTPNRDTIFTPFMTEDDFPYGPYGGFEITSGTVTQGTVIPVTELSDTSTVSQTVNLPYIQVINTNYYPEYIELTSSIDSTKSTLDKGPR